MPIRINRRRHCRPGEPSGERRAVQVRSDNGAKQLRKMDRAKSGPASAVWKCVTDSDSLRFDIVDQVMLIVHADVPPSDSDWTRLQVVRDANRAKLRSTLVIAPPRASINAA